MNDDATLLRRYADERSETAFAELVRRHLDLVYSAALRRLGGDAQHAADVAQQVFTKLAREAAPLARHGALTAWLYTATRNAAIDLIRSEQRRRTREQEAYAMQEIFAAAPEANWERLRPVLDAAMDELAENERTAILQRFFEKRPFADIGAALRVSEDAARMRVDRALEKLHGQLVKRGLTSTSMALAAALAGHSVTAAPAGLAATITGSALAAAVGASSAFAWINFFTMTKIKIGLVSAMAVAGLMTTLVELRASRALNAELDGLRTENAEIDRLRADNRRLAAATPSTTKTAKENAPGVTPSAGRKITAPQIAKRNQLVAEMKPRSAWRNVGIATPADAFETQLWASDRNDLDVLASTYALSKTTSERVGAFFAAMSEPARVHFGTPEKLSAFFRKFGPWDAKVKRPEVEAFRILNEREIQEVGWELPEGEGWVCALTRNADGTNGGRKYKLSRTSDGWKQPSSDPESQWQKIVAYFDPVTGQPRNGK